MPAAQEDPGEELDPSQPVLFVEHCRSWRVFRRRAEELHAALKERGLQQLQLRLNASGAPRRGSFELSLAKAKANEKEEELVLLWSGLKRGPPRALKFPNAEEVFEEIVRILDGEKAKAASDKATEAKPEEDRVGKSQNKPKKELLNSI